MVPSYPDRRHSAIRLVVLGALAAALAAQFVTGRPAWAAAGTWKQYTYSGSAGSRVYDVYTPYGYTPAARVPLVMMLHGCNQTPLDLALGTRMNDLADSKQFIAVYPQETGTYLNCWQWFMLADQARGSGEPAILAGITHSVMSNTALWNVNPGQVFVTGISAGGAMAVVMGATYPDLYSAIGVGSGAEYKAATDAASAGQVRFSGGPSPTTVGGAAYQAMGSFARVVPVIVFHGTSDTVVYPINGVQVVQQWMQTDHLASANTYNPSYSSPSATIYGQVPGGQAYTVRKWNNSAGTEIEEYWTVTGMGHAWSGGSTAGSLTDPYGPSETTNMFAFFIAHSR
jgi:poly(hydroxyalkanoate) depolymerase family esterase